MNAKHHTREKIAVSLIVLLALVIGCVSRRHVVDGIARVADAGITNVRDDRESGKTAMLLEILVIVSCVIALVTVSTLDFLDLRGAIHSVSTLDNHVEDSRTRSAEKEKQTE